MTTECKKKRIWPKYFSLSILLTKLRMHWKTDFDWYKPKDIFKGEDYCVMKSPVKPMDVRQRVLGDCYFLSSLMALADYPHRLERIFRTKEVQPSGCYCVALCVMGVWEEIIIDDSFPCSKVSKKPCFSDSLKKELWVLLIEKAFAKISGGYSNLFGGLDSEAMYMLTGAPTAMFRFDEGSADSIYDIMKDGFNNMFLMAAASGSKEDIMEKTNAKLKGKLNVKILDLKISL